MSHTVRIPLVLLAMLGAGGCQEAAAPDDLPGITGTIEQHADFASAFVDARNIDVWLPPGYRESENRYAVLYMHDGQNLFDPTKSYIGVDWGVDEAMTALIDSHVVQPALVVGIWNTPKRVAEYMPLPWLDGLTDNEVRDFRAEYGDPEASDQYLRFIVDELKPFIDQTYRTKSDRENTFIMGSSMGGLISLYAVTKYPEVFGGAGCVSTHWPIVGPLTLSYLEEKLSTPGRHQLYFDYGTETLDAEYEPYQLKVDSLLRSKGFSIETGWMTRRYEGDDHSERSWRRRVHVPLEMFLGDSPL